MKQQGHNRVPLFPLTELARFSHLRQSIIERIMHGRSPRQVADPLQLERHLLQLLSTLDERQVVAVGRRPEAICHRGEPGQINIAGEADIRRPVDVVISKYDAKHFKPKTNARLNKLIVPAIVGCGGA